MKLMSLHTVLHAFSFIVLALWQLSCDETPYKVEILSYDPVTDEMVLKVETIHTLDDVGKLEGRATTLLGGVSIELDYLSGMVRWNRVGTPVAFNAIQADNVYYPVDFDSLAMVSVYHNIEQSMLFFESIGMPEGALGDLDTYYRADVLEIYSDDWTQNEKSVDNAFYLPISETDRGFYILPFDLSYALVDGVPLSMNPGVIAHEYSHAVFQNLIYDKMPPATTNQTTIYDNYLWALNEGIADIFAVALTGDPDFIKSSIQHRAVTRDASEVILYTTSFDENIMNTVWGESLDPYEIGAFISATVYEMGRRFQGFAPNGSTIPGPAMRKAMARFTYNALFQLGAGTVKFFEPADFFSELMTQLAPAQKQIACDVLLERFAIHYDEVEGCL